MIRGDIGRMKTALPIARWAFLLVLVLGTSQTAACSSAGDPERAARLTRAFNAGFSDGISRRPARSTCTTTRLGRGQWRTDCRSY